MKEQNLTPIPILLLALWGASLAPLQGQILLNVGTSGTFIPDGQGAYYQGFEKAPVNHNLFLCISANESKAPGGGNLANPNGFAAGYNYGTGSPDLTETVTDASSGNTYLLEPFIDIANPLSLDAVPLVGGYRVFLFDSNQTGSSPLLDITTLQIYTSDTEPVNSAADVFTENLAYGLDGGGDLTVQATGNTGTSRWNMALYVPDPWFVRAPGGDSATYIHFYTEHLNDNDGFDHWGIDPGLGYDFVPEPSGAILLLLGAFGLTSRRRRPARA